MVCLKRCYEALEIGGRLAVLIGDVRRGGKYTPIVKDVLNLPMGEIRINIFFGTGSGPVLIGSVQAPVVSGTNFDLRRQLQGSIFLAEWREN